MILLADNVFCIFIQKQYAALVWISRPLKDDDLQSISSHKDMVSFFLIHI